MAKIYYRNIRNGTITIEDVPERWIDAVRTLLDEDSEE